MEIVRYGYQNINGKLINRKKSKEEGQHEDVIIGGAVDIDKVLINMENDDVILKLSFVYRHRTKEIEIPREELTSYGLQKLLRAGADTFSDNVKSYIKYLNKAEKTAEEELIYKDVGWGMFGKEKVFKGGKLVSAKGVKATYKGVRYDLSSKGTFEGWKGKMEELVLGRKWLELSLIMGLTAAVVGLLSLITEVDSLLFHLYGESSKGKTTSTMLALSPFGKPDNRGGGLLKTWNGSDVSVLAKFRSNFGIPVGLDEASVKGSEKDFSKILYQAFMGRDKERLDQTGKELEAAEWATGMISNAENSLLKNSKNHNNGLRVRIIEIGNKELTESDAHAKALKEAIMNNYGTAGIEFAKGLVKIEDEQLLERLKKAEKRILSKMKKTDSLSGRIASKMGIVILTAELAKEILGLEINVDMIEETLLELEGHSLEERNIAEKAYDVIVQEITRNEKKFKTDKGSCYSTEIWGKIYKGNKVVILKDKFDEIMKVNGFNNPQPILQKWRDIGILETQSDRLMSKRTVMNMSRASVYILNLKHSFEELEDLEDTEDVVEVKIERITYKTSTKKAAVEERTIEKCQFREGENFLGEILLNEAEEVESSILDLMALKGRFGDEYAVEVEDWAFREAAVEIEVDEDVYIFEDIDEDVDVDVDVEDNIFED